MTQTAHLAAAALIAYALYLVAFIRERGLYPPPKGSPALEVLEIFTSLLVIAALLAAALQ